MTPDALREHPTVRRILRLLHVRPLSRTELAGRTGLHPDTVRERLNALQRAGHVLPHTTVPRPDGGVAVLWVSTRLRARIGAPRHPPRWTHATRWPLPTTALKRAA